MIEPMENFIESQIGGLVTALLADYQKGRTVDALNLFQQPCRTEIIAITQGLLRLVYPGYYRDKTKKIYDVKNDLSVTAEDVMYHLNKQICLALSFGDNALPRAQDQERAPQLSVAFFQKIPAVRAILETDIDAAYDGDPAAQSKEEIILSYPGVLAVTIYRLAHELFLLNVPLIPRIMTEYAHSQTGIDIHPGAAIGPYFFIDHGTGIVIGETTVIGQNVKIYQGVTLGALSTRGGQRLRGEKRHPTIEDNVTIYAGASILGGDTVIGRNSVIGGNAFITASIPASTRVSIKNQELFYHQDRPAIQTPQELEQGEAWYYMI
jgi:serine O-acetyltransferase